mmetsp:Transcript_41358/g.39822  ORF Transcript_41358/g.39822 Transcript_41358/m.39822 type:complete len:88 (-) Transcript_41358:25-288(-)
MPLVPHKIEDLNPPDYLILHNGRMVRQIMISVQNVHPASNSDCPAMSIPSKHYQEGELPINMEIFTLQHEDKKLIALSRTIEKILLA